MSTESTSQSKENTDLRYGIRIRSWGGISYNAHHYYAKAWCYDEGNEGLLFEEECVHQLTESDARKLNVKDQTLLGLGHYHPSDETNRFDTQEQAIEAGAVKLKDRYGDKIIIEIGEYFFLREDNEVYKKGRYYDRNLD